MNLTFVHKELVHLLWLALGLAGALGYLELRRGAGLARILSPRMQVRLCQTVSPQRRALRVGCMALALLLGVLALMRPQTPGEPEPTAQGGIGGDVLVVLDTSQSMLAEDAAPSRLGRAKAELVDLLGKLGGQRVGLVAFAGRAQVLCPLTPDLGFFRGVLDGVNTRSVARGGTRIGDGLRVALAAFGPGGGSRLILLITDGEDQDSYPMDAARAAKDAGVRVVAIGFGDERGSEISLTDPGTGARRVLTDRDGQPVRSRLDGKTLRDIALATGGAYIPAGVAALDLDAIVREHIQPLFRDQRQGEVVQALPREHYPALVLGALLCVLGSAWAGARARRFGVTLALLLGLGLAPRPALAADGGVAEGSKDAKDGKESKDAAPAAGGAKESLPPRRSYNQARAAYQAGELVKAEQGFLAARDGAGGDSELRYRSAFNLGLVRARRADELEKEKPQEAIAALHEAAAWFRDAVRQRSPEGDADKRQVAAAEDARVNLELVLRRAQQLADRLNQGQNGLEARLSRVLQDQRTLRERVRALLGRVQQAGGGTEPLRFQGEFDDSSTFQRTLLADAGAVLDLAGQEKDKIAAKPEDKRADEERGRLIQLQNLEHYLNEARGTMADVSRRLRRLQGDRAHRQADSAVTQLKRALEQLMDPVAVMKGLAGDQVQVLAQTRGLEQLQAQAQQVASSAAPASAPAWLTAGFLATQQQDLQPRAQELLARLRAGVEHGDKAPAADQSGQTTTLPSASDPKEVARRRVLQAAREALPLLTGAEAAMGRAVVALQGAQLPGAGREQEAVLRELARALERFSGVRDLIELLYGEQAQVLELLTPPSGAAAQKGAALTTAQRQALLKEGVGRNRERAARLQGLFAEEVQALDGAEKAGQAPAAGQAPGGADPAAQKEQIKAQRERYRQAEELRQKAAAALQRLEAALQATTGKPREVAKEAQDHIEALRRLFFSIIEHLKDLHHQQTGTHDDTSTAQAQKDDNERRRRMGPLADAQGRHAALAKALGEALAAQADQAASAPAGGPSQPGQPGQPSQPDAAQAAKTLAQAAEEVRKAHGTMTTAQGHLSDDLKAPVTPDLEPVLGQQKLALQHLEQAIALLEPPQQDQKQQDQKKEQQDQKQLSQEQAARRLQAIREREAERQRDKGRRQPAEREPVEKDW